MTETPNQVDNQEREESGSANLLTHWRSCLLLFVMLLGLLATPLAVFYRWYSDRPANGLSSLTEQDEGAGRIAFITPDQQLATMAPDGGDVRRVTDAMHGFEFPAWAPDGGNIAVTGGDTLLVVPTGSDQGAGGSTIELYQNTEEPPFYLYWSPDSQYVSFLVSQPDGIALRLADLEGNDVGEETVAAGQPFYWDWAPGAEFLLIHRGNSGSNAQLEMIEPNGGETTEQFGDPGFFQAPGISNSGRYRAFATLDEEGRSRLAIQDNAGDERLYEAHFGQIALTWSPAADILAYKSPRLNSRLGGGPLRLLDPRTNEASLLSNKNVLAYFWSPDGRTIAYFTLPQDDDSDVRVAAADGKPSFRARSQRQPGELRLELWAVDVAGRHQRRLAEFAPTTLFLRQFLPFFDQYALSHRIWSPNSDALVIPVLEEGRSQIAVAPLSRGDVQLIADGEIAFWSHQ